MKALKTGGWLLLAVSVIHCLAGVFSGEFNYPSMKALWLTAITAVCLFLSVTCFAALALVKRAKGKNGMSAD